ncbi:uncharacterized protein LOC5513742 [Nematostella vectensis]|uniref:uncharacterized protein LOC5513742 n=1 Tax=Nematostella vectensis TaxID=45351 RepID=UPI002077660C|nr:uncharacterized protein LOC5513742 [Nematostella vectensis]XP_048582531.1 uncharacterized protein LOC5513742 [Nematostella vectensis]
MNTIWLFCSILVPLFHFIDSSSVCGDGKNLTVGVYHLAPYVFKDKLLDGKLLLDPENHNKAGLFFDKIYNQMIYPFYKDCMKEGMRVKILTAETAEEMLDLMINNDTDFAFPITQDIKRMFDATNVSDVLPSKLVVTLASKRLSLVLNTKSCRQQLQMEMLDGLLQQWPIVAVTLILAAIAGVIVWILETRHNSNEFPRSFLRGTYEGFWWAFVSMTTVGYGDRTPRTVFGRLFGVIWIMIGIIVVAFFTATFSSVITISIVSNTCQKAEGKRLAVLNNTELAQAADDNGATAIVMDSFKEMVAAVEKGAEVDGMLVEEIMAHYLMTSSGRARYKISEDIQITGSIVYEKLVRVYTMFRKLLDGMKESDLVLNARYDAEIIATYTDYAKNPNAADAQQPFSGKSANTQRLLIILASVFGGLVFLAFLCDIFMRIYCSKIKDKSQVNLEMNLPQQKKSSSRGMEKSLKQIMDELTDIKTKLERLEKSMKRHTERK